MKNLQYTKEFQKQKVDLSYFTPACYVQKHEQGGTTENGHMQNISEELWTQEFLKKTVEL